MRKSDQIPAKRTERDSRRVRDVGGAGRRWD